MSSQVYVSSKIQDFKYNVAAIVILKFIRYSRLLIFRKVVF